MKLPRLLSAAVGTLSLLSAAHAADADRSLESRVEQLEREVQQLRDENATLRHDAGLPAARPSVIVLPAGKETQLVVGGFLQGQAEFGGVPDARWSGVKDRFFFRRARIFVNGSLGPDWDFKAELDLQGNSLSAGTGLYARANEVYVDWRHFPFLNLRFGQLKPAYGAESLAADTALLTIERSLSSDRLTDSRQMAVAALGTLPGDHFSYVAVVANGNGSNVSANDNSKWQRSARLAYALTPAGTDTLTFGVDGLWSTDAGIAKAGFGFTGDKFSGQRAMQGVDAHWTHGPFDLDGEWLSGTFEPADRVPRAKFDAAGWQVGAGLFVVPKVLEALIREEAFDPDTSVGGNTIRTTTLGLNYFVLGDDLKVTINYLHGGIPGAPDPVGRLLTRVQVKY